MTWRSLQAAPKAAHELPWSHAVLRALELDAYAALPRHVPGWLGERIGIDAESERRCLELLAVSGQIRKQGRRWQVARPSLIDLRGEPAAVRSLREFWFEVGLGRLRAEQPGTFSYNLSAVSAADHARIRALYRAFFSEIESIIAASRPVERVLLMNFQLLDLGGHTADRG
jgi:hypothetical protein